MPSSPAWKAPDGIASPRRWVAPSGAQLDLTHMTHTGRNYGRPGLRDGGCWDGYCLLVRSPNGIVISSTYFGEHLPDDLKAALAAVEAVRVDDLPRPERTTA
jgi:hypothetical protein